MTEELIRDEKETVRAHRYALKVYWLSLTIVALLTIVVCMLAEPRQPLVGPFMILGFLPVGQLAASILAAIYVRWKPPARQDLVLRRIGRITLFAFFGALVGVAGTIISFFHIDKL